MEKKSGVGENSTSLPGGGGGIRSIGDAFEPNLAMGGGSYKVPLDLPQGPGGFSTKLDIIYNTGFGNGPLGLGWLLSIPYIDRKRRSPYAPPGETEYTLSGSQALVPAADGTFVPFVQQTVQRFVFDGSQWTSQAPNLVSMRFGATAESRLTGEVDGTPVVSRWLLDRVIFPGGRTIAFEYQEVGSQRYLQRIRWSVFRLEFAYEDRPDPFSQFDTGFELRMDRRLTSISLHQDRLAPETLMRVYRFDYAAAERLGTSLLAAIRIAGYRFANGALEEASLAPLRFTYTGFDPAVQDIRKFSSAVVPPPPLGDDATLLDYRGVALPGILRMNGTEATYWENRGGMRWGPPQRLSGLPQGLHLSNDQVRFADLSGKGTADLVVARALGGGYYPHDPEQGFLPKRSLTLEPSFDLGEADSYMIDLDGDRVADLLTFRNGVPLAFFNDGGERWSGPVVLPSDALPNLHATRTRVRFADMNGDGNPDLVLLYSRQIVYYPSLGNGRWGAARIMANTPEFTVPRPDDDVHLADIDGDGTADLIIVGNGVIRIYLNAGGESFSAPIELNRTPRLGVEHFLLADMTGSGTVGMLWTTEFAKSAPHEYWYLDPLRGVKPYLLKSIDNGSGLVTDIEYTTSVFERTADLADGYRWSGYLPFVVHVVKRMRQRDAVTGQQAVTEYRYHDGHYDHRNREYLGFASVDSLRLPTAHEAAIHQRFSFHNRSTTATDPAFIAGKGQPHRTELIEPMTGEIRQVEESQWHALPVQTADTARPAYLAVEQVRSSRRMQGGEVYASEQIQYLHDAIGNITREVRRSEWTDSAGTPRVDQFEMETFYALHPTFGLTNIPSRVRKKDASGRLLKDFKYFYDGLAFTGLALGSVENGFKTRQTETALTQAEIAEAYGGVAPTLLTTLYRMESDPEFGTVFVRDLYRYRVDGFGNQLETIDALGHHVVITYDAESIHPVLVSEDDGPARVLTYDPIAQQLARAADLNGNIVETHYDGLGHIVALYKRGAQPGLPTESYEYHRDVVPNVCIRRIRIRASDAQPGAVQYEYRDGAGRVAQVKVLTADGRWAVGKQELRSIAGRLIGERDAYFSATFSFEAAPPVGLAERQLFYDFAGRVTSEFLFSGHSTRYIYDRHETRFYDPDAAAALAVDPTTAPSRISRTNANDKIVSIVERDGAGQYEERREYDALGRLTQIIDPLGHIVLASTFDLWGNRIRVQSAESGTTVYAYDAANNEILKTNADGRSVYTPRDLRGRITEARTGGPGGVVEETYTYDTGAGNNLNGRLARVTGGFGTVEYSYSVEGDPERIRRTFAGHPTMYEVQFTYDNQRKVRSVTYPDGTLVNVTYDATGMLTGLPGYINSIEYGPTGKRERIVFANGLETRKTLTPGDYLERELITQTIGGTITYQHLVYGLDAAGRVTNIQDLSNVAGKIRNNQTFEYDGRNRLRRSTGRGADGDYAFEYRYDALGNLVFSGESFAEEMDYGHHVGDTTHPNRLIKRRASAIPEYGYDACGNLTSDPAIGTFSYDSRHRLIRVDKLDGSVVEYRYDHNDRRTETRVNSDGVTSTLYEVEGLYLIENGTPTKIVFDDDRRLAIVPQTGDPLLHHLDRIGNVNVVSNLSTGTFVGHDEYTPYGRLSVSMVIMPHFSFQGGQFSDGLGIVLLGARYYSPALGRFLTPDSYLSVHQEKIAGIIAATNLYLYALANPVNYVDPTGQIAFLAVLLIAVVVGAALGALGAALNGAQTWDEWLLWIVGGAIGAVLAVMVGAGLAVLFGGSAIVGAIAALIVWSAASLLGSIFTPILDNSNSPVAWFFSFLLKWIQSPVTTTVGLVAALVVLIAGGKVDFRRGMLFIEVGPGGGALTLGAVAWTQSGRFGPDGRIPDNLARHEAYHSRTVAALGELGFYFTYVTVGAIWGVAQGGAWNDLNGAGCGNPFEKTAHTFTMDPAVAVAANRCG